LDEVEAVEAEAIGVETEAVDEITASTSLIIMWVCVDEGLQETCDGGLSASDIFCSKFQTGSCQLLSLTIPAVLTRRSSPPLSAFRCKKRMLSQKERVESGEVTWRRGLYCKEKMLL